MFVQARRLSMQLSPSAFNLSYSQFVTSEDSEVQLSLETTSGPMCNLKVPSLKTRQRMQVLTSKAALL